jgi:hypothetical protein
VSGASLLVLCVLAAPAVAAPRWLRANFHAHAARDQVRDDGAESPAELHRALRERGFDFSVHSPHSTLNTDAQAAARFSAQREAEARLQVDGLTIAVGQELTVAPGAQFQKRIKVLGRNAPGNLNHLSVFGMKEMVPSLTPLAKACDQVHAGGGVCIVNHPGPGPMMWEDGLWESPANRDKIDALEVYNGQALSAVGLEFESRYREATSYGGLGLKIAAVTGADTHGPRSVERARAKLVGMASMGGVGTRLLKLVLPESSEPRAELEAATLVLADGAGEPEVVKALKARRTVATYGLRGIGIEHAGLGEVRKTGEVALRLKLSRKVAEVTLYREGAAVRTWTDVSEVEWKETVAQPTAYVFAARDGGGRLTTSATWYEPHGK